MGERTKRLALVASKGTLDMAYPPLILATTATSLGWEAGIFFTFYGLDILHKDRLERLQVSPIGNPAMPPPISSVPGLKVPNLLGVVPGMTAVAPCDAPEMRRVIAASADHPGQRVGLEHVLEDEDVLTVVVKRG